MFTNPRPSESEIGPYYESKDYMPHSGSNPSLTGKIYRAVRKLALRQKLSLVNSLATKGRMLDIGCGTGEFLAKCQADGWKTSGVEPSDSARDMAKSRGMTVVATFKKEDYAAASLDLITMWHVMEHVHDLAGTVSTIAASLKPDGVLVVAVPNHTSCDAKAYGEFWGAYDVPRHLHHFSPASIRRLLEPAGFKFEGHRSMWFDSVYVSLMGERYQCAEKVRSNSVIRAAYTGLVSNVLSLFKPGTCSSHIYVFRKLT